MILPELPRLKKEFVYLISEPGGLVKIGVATNPKKRRDTLQSGNPSRLSLDWFTPGNKALESALHAEFSQFRVAGEWFDFRGKDTRMIVPAKANELKEKLPSRFTHPTRVEKVVLEKTYGDEEGVFYGKEGVYYFKYFYEEQS